jgi:hypothetical protein
MKTRVSLVEGNENRSRPELALGIGLAWGVAKRRARSLACLKIIVVLIELSSMHWGRRLCAFYKASKPLTVIGVLIGVSVWPTRLG